MDFTSAELRLTVPGLPHTMSGMKLFSALLAASLVLGYNLIASGEDSPQAAEAASGGYTGTVTETMNVSPYTYLQVDTGKEKIWAAAPAFQVKVGDKVTIPKGGTPMEKFESKSLKRTFDLIYFVGKIEEPNGTSSVQPATADPHASPHGAPKPVLAPIDFSGIKKADGGLTVAEIYAKKSDLSTKSVSVRGKVVKFNPQILDKNWVHIQDGTGSTGSNDITVTTKDSTKVGDTVLVTGEVALNKDFGQGYKYSLLLENAKVVVEAPPSAK